MIRPFRREFKRLFKTSVKSLPRLASGVSLLNYALRFNGVDDWVRLPVYTFPTSGTVTLFLDFEVSDLDDEDGHLVLLNHWQYRLYIHISKPNNLFTLGIKAPNADNLAGVRYGQLGFQVGDRIQASLVYNFDTGSLDGSELYINGNLMTPGSVIPLTDQTDIDGFKGQTTVSSDGYTSIGNGFNIRWAKFDLFKFAILENNVPVRNYDPTASNGTGLILKDTIGGHDGTLESFGGETDSWWLSNFTSFNGGYFLRLDGVDDWIDLPQYTFPTSGTVTLFLDVGLYDITDEDADFVSFHGSQRFDISVNQHNSRVTIIYNQNRIKHYYYYYNLNLQNGDRIQVFMSLDLDTGDVSGNQVYVNGNLTSLSQVSNPMDATAAAEFKGFTTNNGRRTNLGNGFNVRYAKFDLYRFAILENDVLVRDYDPTASNGRDLILIDTVSRKDGKLNGYSDDHSQWGFYV